MRDAAARALGASRTPRPRTRVAALAALFLLALAVRSLYALDLAPVMYSRVQPGTRMAWRYDEAALDSALTKRLKDLTFITGRGYTRPEPVAEQVKVHHPRTHSTHPQIPHPHHLS